MFPNPSFFRRQKDHWELASKVWNRGLSSGVFSWNFPALFLGIFVLFFDVFLGIFTKCIQMCVVEYRQLHFYSKPRKTSRSRWESIVDFRCQIWWPCYDGKIVYRGQDTTVVDATAVDDGRYGGTVTIFTVYSNIHMISSWNFIYIFSKGFPTSYPKIIAIACIYQKLSNFLLPNFIKK